MPCRRTKGPETGPVFLRATIRPIFPLAIIDPGSALYNKKVAVIQNDHLTCPGWSIWTTNFYSLIRHYLSTPSLSDIKSTVSFYLLLL